MTCMMGIYSYDPRSGLGGCNASDRVRSPFSLEDAYCPESEEGEGEGEGEGSLRS